MFKLLPTKLFLATLALAALGLSASRPVFACPFCTAVSQTLTEQFDSVDAAVIVRLEKLPDPELAQDPAGDLPLATFSLVTALTGKEYFQGEAAKQPIEAIFFGDGKVGDKYLLTGVEPIRWNWSSPVKISDVGETYLKRLGDAAEKGPERLAFFLPYLNHADPLLAQDAYEEFARAPYDEVVGIKDKLEPEKLVGWIESPEVSSSSRRLYLTLLGVCGGEKQYDLLQRLMTTEDRKLRAALDAAIACWLTLRGAEGCDLIDRLFIENQKSEYADTYAAIMALRFHGTESDVVPRERILVSFRKMLDRPPLADLVIPDLARWKDWSVKQKLVDVYRKADKESKNVWVRMPIVAYFRACPDEDAKTILKELEKIDPDAIRRANATYFVPEPATESPAATDAAPAAEPQPNDASYLPLPADGIGGEILLAKAPAEFVSTVAQVSATEAIPAAEALASDGSSAKVAATLPSEMAFNAADLAGADGPAASAPTWWMALGVFALAMSVCGAVQWSLLRG
jgi:hypothetical protein